MILIRSISESLLMELIQNIHVHLFDLISIFQCFFQGPLPSTLKGKGGSPFSQYEMLGSDTLGMQSQGTADSWHRTPGSKMGNKSATSSWPPGWHGFFSVTIYQRLIRIKRSRAVSALPLLT